MLFFLEGTQYSQTFLERPFSGLNCVTNNCNNWKEILKILRNLETALRNLQIFKFFTQNANVFCFDWSIKLKLS